jgi:hypothetical protein
MALAHVHAARRLHFAASSDGLLLFLSEECWGRGLVRLASLLDHLLIERHAEQPEPALDPELEALLVAANFIVGGQIPQRERNKVS